MYPLLFQAANRLSPVLQRLMSRGGSFASPTWKTDMFNPPGVTPSPPEDPNVPHPPISGNNTQAAPNASPVPYPNSPFGLGMGAPHPMGPGPFMLNSPPPQAAPQAAPQPQQAAPSVPLPMARPDQAPAPTPTDTGFFARNTAMMRDPSTGAFIDPSAAQSVRGPDLIAKMMSYLHNKDMG